MKTATATIIGNAFLARLRRFAAEVFGTATIVAALGLSSSCVDVDVHVDAPAKSWAIEAARGGWLIAGAPYPDEKCLADVRSVSSGYPDMCELGEHREACLSGTDIIVDPDSDDRTKAIAHAALHVLAKCGSGVYDWEHSGPYWIPYVGSAEWWMLRLIEAEGG